MFRNEKRSLLLLGFLVFSAVLLLRWGFVDRNLGRSFSPAPDSLEYAAAAHEIADTGRFELTIGEVSVRPRYAPGWSMLLAPATLLGVRGEALVLMTGLVGALHALLLAFLAYLASQFFSKNTELSQAQASTCALWAFATTGFGWALCPISVDLSRYILSDEAAAFFANAGLALAIFAFLQNGKARRSLLACVLAGLCVAVAAAVRTVSSYLLFGPLLLCAFAALSTHGIKSTLLRLAAIGCGIFPVVLLVYCLLTRSGHDPWTWSAYGFWDPENYPTVDNPGFERTFHRDFALAGNPKVPFTLAGRALGHLEIALRLFFGMMFGAESASGARSYGLGLIWPVLGWGFGVALVLQSLRLKLLGKLTVWLVTLALLGWFAGHVVLYSLYFYPAERFFIAPLAWCWVFTGIGLPLLLRKQWAKPRGFLCFLSLAIPFGILVSVLLSLRPLLGTDNGRPHTDNEEARRMLARWLSWSDREREQRFIPFDPVRAQALGLLDPALRRRIKSWGKIPVTGHRQQLIDHGLIPSFAGQEAGTERKDKTLSFPYGSRVPGSRRVHFDAESKTYRLWLEDLGGNVLVDYRVPLESKEIEQGLLRVREAKSGSVVLQETGLPIASLDANRHEAVLLSHGLNRYRQSVKLEFADRYRRGDKIIERRKTYELRLVGRSLELQFYSPARSDNDASLDYASLRVGKGSGIAAEYQALAWPGMSQGTLLMNDQGQFVSRLLASPSAKRTREAICETLWLTQSRQFMDCLPVHDLAPGIERAWPRKPSVGDLLLRGFNLTSLLLADRRKARPLVDAWLLHGLQRELFTAGRMELSFVDAKGNKIALGPALLRGMRPDNARMIFAGKLGLRLYVNHGTSTWQVEDEDGTVLLPPAGYFAAAPSGLLLLSALHPISKAPFAYAMNPGHSELLDTKAGKFSSDGLQLPAKARIDALVSSGPATEVVIRDLAHWNWVRIEDNLSSMSARLEPEPQPRALEIRMHGDPILSFGRRSAQLRCFAVDDKGRKRELANRVEWLSLPPGIVEIDGRHRLNALGFGKVILIAKARGLEVRKQIEVMALRVSKLETHMISPQEAIVSLATGVGIYHASLWLTRKGSGRKRIFFADSDPAARVHHFQLDALEPGEQYSVDLVVMATAKSAPIFMSLGEEITVR